MFVRLPAIHQNLQAMYVSCRESKGVADYPSLHYCTEHREEQEIQEHPNRLLICLKKLYNYCHNYRVCFKAFYCSVGILPIIYAALNPSFI